MNQLVAILTDIVNAGTPTKGGYFLKKLNWGGPHTYLNIDLESSTNKKPIRVTARSPKGNQMIIDISGAQSSKSVFEDAKKAADFILAV